MLMTKLMMTNRFINIAIWSMPKLTHKRDSSTFCINLIFIASANLVLLTGFQSTLDSNCHHEIVYAQFDLSIYYLPPYRHYQHAKAELAAISITGFNWGKKIFFI